MIIVLSGKRADWGEIIVESGYLNSKSLRPVVFKTVSYSRENPTFTITYVFYSIEKQIMSQGTRTIEVKAIPEMFSLHQNYPNPFNPLTTVHYDLPEGSNVTVVIYDILGRQVRTLVNKDQEAGYYTVKWDGKNNNGNNVSSGMYLYSIQAGDFFAVRKMVLLR